MVRTSGCACIESFFTANPTRGYVGRNIGEVPGSELNADLFGHYDPTPTVATFWDKSVVLTEICDEAQRILVALNAGTS